MLKSLVTAAVFAVAACGTALGASTIEPEAKAILASGTWVPAGADGVDVCPVAREVHEFWFAGATPEKRIKHFAADSTAATTAAAPDDHADTIRAAELREQRITVVFDGGWTAYDVLANDRLRIADAEGVDRERAERRVVLINCGAP
jgi:hypothetical protein